MGREFIDLFDQWAHSYDETVTGHDIEYKEVFQDYDKILEAVSNRVNNHVLEFGVGTGNLTQRLLNKGYTVTGIEPSSVMREKASNKLSGLTILDGDFLNFQVPELDIDGIVSTYAFHHLTDDEKQQAIEHYSHLLDQGGKVVFADTVFKDELAKLKMIEQAESQHFFNLAEDLRTEFYTTIPTLKRLFHEQQFDVTFIQYNDFVWVIDATKR